MKTRLLLLLLLPLCAATPFGPGGEDKKVDTKANHVGTSGREDDHSAHDQRGYYEIKSLGGAAQHQSKRMGLYIPTGESISGFPVFEKDSLYLYVNPHDYWMVGPNTSSTVGGLYHDNRNPTPEFPPVMGWKYWNDGWQYDASLTVIFITGGDICQNGQGEDYSGSVNQTKSGFACEKWSIQSSAQYNSLGNHNYCRNPDPHPLFNNRVWCFSTNPDKEWEYCDVPRCDLCQNGHGEDYSGSVRKTKSGFACKQWSIQSSAQYNSLGDHNYCRNPDGEPGVWCFSTNPGNIWEFCDVPVCKGSTALIILGSNTKNHAGPECTLIKNFIPLSNSVKVICLTPEEHPNFCLLEKPGIRENTWFTSNARVTSWYNTCGFPGDEGENKTELDAAVKMVENHIEELRINDGIPSENIVLAGFAQGGSLALYTALHTKYKLGGIIGVETWLPLLTKEPPTSFHPVNVKTPVFHLNGRDDPMVSAQLGIDTHQQLSKVITDYTFDLSNGVLSKYGVGSCFPGEKQSDPCIYDKIANWLYERNLLGLNYIPLVRKCHLYDFECRDFDTCEITEDGSVCATAFSIFVESLESIFWRFFG